MLSHSADELVVVAATVVESGASGVLVVDEAELVVLVVSVATLAVGASDVWVAAAVVVVSGPLVSLDVVVHAAITAHTTTDPTSPLVFTTHLQTSRVQSGAGQEVEDNDPTALLAVLDESIRACLQRGSPRSDPHGRPAGRPGCD